MMEDTLGRRVTYLRLSVTDLCNYRCRYCMEENGVEKRPHDEILRLEELAEIGCAAAACGVTKIRLTGGEPLVRPGIITLCRELKAIPGLRELTMTTNGSLLPQYAAELRDAGVDRLNVSLDTLNPEKFAAISRCGTLETVWEGLRAAWAAGFRSTKLNTVLMGGVNEEEIPALAELTRRYPISLRFIELMPMGPCAAWPAERFLSADAVLSALPQLSPTGVEGVSECYRLPGGQGTVGLIRPLSHCFCAGCTRVRVTADGMLKPCLHSKSEIPLRGLHGEELAAAIREGILAKPARHKLAAQHPSKTPRAMNQIGG